jgi:hypothetical protein
VPSTSLQRIPATITKVSVQPPVVPTGSRTQTGSHTAQTGSQYKSEMKAFECVTCRMEFAYVKELVHHIRKEQHTVPKIGCNFCKFKADMAPADVRTHHMFSRILNFPVLIVFFEKIFVFS